MPDLSPSNAQCADIDRQRPCYPQQHPVKRRCTGFWCAIDDGAVPSVCAASAHAVCGGGRKTYIPRKIEVRFTDEQETGASDQKTYTGCLATTSGNWIAGESPSYNLSNKFPTVRRMKQLCPIQEHLENVEDSAPDADASAQTITSILSTQRYTHLYDGKNTCIQGTDRYRFTSFL